MFSLGFSLFCQILCNYFELHVIAMCCVQLAVFHAIYKVQCYTYL